MIFLIADNGKDYGLCYGNAREEHITILDLHLSVSEQGEQEAVWDKFFSIFPRWRTRNVPH